MTVFADRVHAVKTEPALTPAVTDPASADARTAPGAAAPALDAAQLAEAFALFSRASEELSSAYNALQEQVGQLTERLAVLMGALPAGVLVLDRAGRIVQANRAAGELFGRDLSGLGEGEALRCLEETETPGEYLLRLPQAEAGAEPRRVARTESELESGDERIVLLHDITDTFRMRLTAERNERLAAMGEMVAGLAHQLRTPLAAALLYPGNLRQSELDPLQRIQVADRALERLRYLERLIRDMLLFARGDSTGRHRFEVCELVTELTHTLEPLARARQVSFESGCACLQASVLGDRKALGGALTNLLENGIQACPQGGQLAFAAVEIDAAESGIGCTAVRFTVRDSGGGVPPELQERLFEPFFTTRAEGTGLGLAIARGVARAHGGDITLRSAPGQGAEFALTVPLASAAASNGDEPT